MREFAVSVLVNLRDRLSGGLNGIRRRLEQLRNLGGRLGIDRLGSALGRVVRQVGLVGAAFTTLSTVAGGALITLGNSLAQRGTEIEDLARRAGVATDALQELAFAGNRRGVTMDALVDGLKELQLRADEFILTGEGSAKEAFERLGLSADDLARGLEQPDALFEDIIGRLGQLDRAAQIRIADEIFGGAGGEQFVQLIDMGVEGIRELRQEARDIGAVISPEQLAIMRQYRNAVQDLTDRYSGLQNMLAEKLLPVLIPLVDQVSAWIDAHRPQIVEAMEQAVAALAEAIPVAIEGFQRMIDIAGPIADAAGTVIERLGGIEAIAIGLGALFSVKLVAALGAFGVALLTTPIGWFVMAVGGAVALIRKEWDTFEPYFENLLGGVKALFEGDVGAILTIIDSLVAIVGQVVIEFGKWIAEVTGLDDAIAGLVDWLNGLGERFRRVAREAAEAIDEGLADVVTFMRDLPAKAGEAIVAGAGKLVEAGAALIQALWDGIKAKFEELLTWVATIPDRIKQAIGEFDPFAGVRSRLQSGWNSVFGGGESGGEDASEGGTPAAPSAPPVGGPPERRSSLDAPGLTGARQLASATPASVGAAPRPERQEVAFAGELVVRVDGPGRVTSTQSSDPRVDIQPQRGPSLALA